MVIIIGDSVPIHHKVQNPSHAPFVGLKKLRLSLILKLGCGYKLLDHGMLHLEAGSAILSEIC